MYVYMFIVYILFGKSSSGNYFDSRSILATLIPTFPMENSLVKKSSSGNEGISKNNPLPGLVEVI